MVKSTAKFVGNARVEITHCASGQQLRTDAGKASGGLGEYGSPVDLLGQALAACALTVMGLQAAREGADLTGCYAEIGDYEEDEEKITVTKLRITFHLKAEFDEKLRKKLEQFARKACYVGNSLTAEKEYTFVYE